MGQRQEIEFCLPAGTDVWEETLDGREWLRLASSDNFVVNSQKYGKIFRDYFSKDFSLQINLLSIECQSKKFIHEANLIQENGRIFKLTANHHVNRLVDLFDRNRLWSDFYLRLRQEKFLMRSREQLLRVLALNILHEDAVTPEDLG